jgi:hypothetical protein
VVEAGDSLQDKLTEMAFEGNVTAAIFLLKGLKPETLRDRIEELNIQDIDPDKLSLRCWTRSHTGQTENYRGDWARHRSWGDSHG